MKTRSQCIIKSFLLITLFITFKASAQTANFSGNWKIDTTRTNFNGAPIFVLPKALRVSETAAGLIIDRTMIGGQEEKHYTEQMTFDGKSSQAITSSGNTETDTLSHSADKTGLIIHMGVKSPDGKLLIIVTENWSLSDNGNTLIDDRQVQQYDGSKYEIKGYYTKQ